MGWQTAGKYVDIALLQEVLEKKFKKEAGYDFKIKVLLCPKVSLHCLKLSDGQQDRKMTTWMNPTDQQLSPVSTYGRPQPRSYARLDC
jgi:hypothetical protein